MMTAWWLAVLAWLMTYAIQSTLLLGAVAVLTRFVVRSEAWRDVFWKAGLVGGVVSSFAVSLTWVQPLAGRYQLGAKVFESVVPVAAGADAETSTLSPGAAPSAEPYVDAPEPGRSAALVTGGPVATATADASAGEADRSTGVAARSALEAVAVPIVVAWIAGALVLLLRLFLRRRSLYRLLADRREVGNGPAVKVFQDILSVTPLRDGVRLTTSPACPLPMALRRGEVCVPPRFLADLDEEQQRGALAHETAHLVRRDPAWLLAAMIVEAVFFFQPLNVFARRQLKEAAEYLCDEWALRAGLGLGLARCLATVASWIQAGQSRMLASTSAIGESRSALVRRVERILRDAPSTNGRKVAAYSAAFALVVAVGLAAPAVARDLSVQATVIRAPDPTAALRDRWSWAMREAATEGSGGFWIVYAIDRPVEPGQHHISDTEGVDFSEFSRRGTPLQSVLGGGDAYTRGSIAVLFHFDSPSGESAIDRMGHRSMTTGMTFGRDPVFWLGTAEDAESVAWLENLLARFEEVKFQEETVDAIGHHATSTIVLPALGRVLADHPAERVRAEAAEGFENHDTPESLSMAEAAAGSDASTMVRQEAAEAIGGIDVERAAAVLVELAKSAPDERVRAEAAEGLGDQQEGRALPALEQVIFEAQDARVQAEAAEALAEFGDASLDLLRRVIREHTVSAVQAEAVEALGDIRSESTLPILAEILAQHPDASVRDEVLDVLADMDSPRSRTMLIDAAIGGTAPDTRREAVELLGHGGDEEARTPEQIEELAELLERLVFQDPDRGVRIEALEAMADLPSAVAITRLRRVIETHPDASIRREAVDVLDEVR